MRCNAKVGELDGAVGRTQDIGRLDIAVDLALIVEISETEQELATNNGNLVFCKDPRFELY